MMYQPQFLVGRTYLTQAGKPVKIIAESERCGPDYRCVQGDDGEDITDEYGFTPGNERGWRYDREGDVGRCTGSAHDFSDPRNLVPGSEVMPQRARVVADFASTIRMFGNYYLKRFFDSFNARGVYQTAKNARKQGIDINVVLLALRQWGGK